jgi:ubiquinone/menaquinone biosynthesis C-methylase UbiE
MSQSYLLSDKELREREIDRLIQQAKLLLDREFGFWGKYTSNKVFDVGCGVGVLGAFLVRKGLKEYVGVDSNANLLSEARELNPVSNCSFLQGSLYSLSEIQAALHDVQGATIVVRYVLQHLDFSLAQPTLDWLLRVERRGPLVLIDAEDSVILEHDPTGVLGRLLEDKSSTQKSKGGNRSALQELTIAKAVRSSIKAEATLKIESGTDIESKKQWCEVLWPVLTSGEEFKSKGALYKAGNAWKESFLSETSSGSAFGIRIVIL